MEPDIVLRLLELAEPGTSFDDVGGREILREAADHILAARACAEMMLQGTGQKLGEELARRVMDNQDNWRWIPVYERLPQDGQHVLAYGVGTGTGCVFSNGTFHYLSTQEYQQLHPQWWMPLPEPPEVK